VFGHGSDVLTVSGDMDGVDTLTEVERLQFEDMHLALDLDSNAGQVARLLSAVFGVDGITNGKYAGIGLFHSDRGMSYEALGAMAVAATGKQAHHEIVELLWANVVGTPLPQAEAAYFTGLLDGGMSIGELAVFAADAAPNATRVELIGLAAEGLAFIPFAG
jgi:hypothetical protein